MHLCEHGFNSAIQISHQLELMLAINSNEKISHPWTEMHYLQARTKIPASDKSLVWSIIINLTGIVSLQTTYAMHEHLCLDDDYTNDLPIFIEKRSICNYELTPVLIYSIKTAPDMGLDMKLCLKGLYNFDECATNLSLANSNTNANSYRQVNLRRLSTLQRTTS